MLPVWEFSGRGDVRIYPLPFNSDQQEGRPEAAQAAEGPLPSNLGDFTANSLNPEF